MVKIVFLKCSSFSVTLSCILTVVCCWALIKARCVTRNNNNEMLCWGNIFLRDIQQMGTPSIQKLKFLNPRITCQQGVKENLKLLLPNLQILNVPKKGKTCRYFKSDIFCCFFFTLSLFPAKYCHSKKIAKCYSFSCK